MDGIGYLLILGGGRRRFDMHDQMGLILLTGFGDSVMCALYPNHSV
jgi:hypothetical protein